MHVFHLNLFLILNKSAMKYKNKHKNYNKICIYIFLVHLLNHNYYLLLYINMLKTIKKCNNSRYETFKLVHVNDPLLAYYIKVNYDNDNNIDVNKIKKKNKI